MEIIACSSRIITVAVSVEDVNEFRSRWPAVGRPVNRAFRFKFALSNGVVGDLIGIIRDNEVSHDALALLALANEAEAFAQNYITEAEA